MSQLDLRNFILGYTCISATNIYKTSSESLCVVYNHVINLFLINLHTLYSSLMHNMQLIFLHISLNLLSIYQHALRLYGLLWTPKNNFSDMDIIFSNFLPVHTRIFYSAFWTTLGIIVWSIAFVLVESLFTIRIFPVIAIFFEMFCVKSVPKIYTKLYEYSTLKTFTLNKFPYFSLRPMKRSLTDRHHLLLQSFLAFAIALGSVLFSCV